MWVVGPMYVRFVHDLHLNAVPSVMVAIMALMFVYVYICSAMYVPPPFDFDMTLLYARPPKKVFIFILLKMMSMIFELS